MTTEVDRLKEELQRRDLALKELARILDATQERLDGAMQELLFLHTTMEALVAAAKKVKTPSH